MLTSTTLPRSDLLLIGEELSQATAPSKSGIRPSSRIPDAIATTALIRDVAEIQNARFFTARKSPFVRLQPRHRGLDRALINWLIVAIHQMDRVFVPSERKTVENDRHATCLRLVPGVEGHKHAQIQSSWASRAGGGSGCGR